MRCACARLRRKAVLLLLALRADERTIGAEGGLHRPRRLGLGPVGPSTSDGGLPPEGRTGVRAAPGPDRDPDRLDSYPHLEVRFHVGDGEGGSFRVGVGNVYPPLVGSSVRATRGTALRRIRPGRPPRRMPAVHRWVGDGPPRHGDLLLPLLLLSRLGREDVP